MGKGRKPIPSKIQRLRGNPGRTPMLPEPEPRALVPECPEFLSDEAKAEWYRVSPELLACGLLTVLDRASLAAYCESWALWLRAEKIVANEGLFAQGTRGSKKTHPAVHIASQAMRQILSIAAEFGLTPSSRVRLAAPGQKKDALEDFLGPRLADSA